MFAVYAARVSPHDPVAGLVVGDMPEPDRPDGWATVRVKAAALNHHDVWTLRGVGIEAAALPMILGCDAAGVDEDGREVIVHAVLGDPDWRGDETLDPRRSLLSERHPGTFAELVTVPRRNLVEKPPGLSMQEAACLPSAWLTAYRMLFTQSDARPGDTVLVQGVGGGVATALIALARVAGLRVFATSRDETKRRLALTLGAHEAFKPGARLPSQVDAVMETVGATTWAHSVRALRPGGTIVISGATTGDPPAAELRRIFYQQKRVHGSTMGTLEELRRLVRLMDITSTRPLIDREIPMERAAEGVKALIDGDVTGKIVLTLQ